MEAFFYYLQATILYNRFGVAAEAGAIRMQVKAARCARWFQ
jgi:hypothetical protein